MERLEHVKGVIFDLDGTLLDSMHVWDDIDKEFLAKRKIALPDDYIEAIHAMEFEEAANYTIKRFQLLETPVSLMEEWESMACYAYGHTVKLKPKVIQFLQMLITKNIKLGIATSLSNKLCLLVLENTSIYPFFSAITTTAEVKKGKEFADVYLETANKLGLEPSQCAVFEDTLLGINSASKAGFITVGVFDEYNKNQQVQIKQKADIYITCFEEI